MDKIQDKKYIKQVGIDKLLCKTGMGNIIYILNDGKKYKEFSSDYRNLNNSANVELAENLILQSQYYQHPVVSFPEIVIKDKKRLYGIVSDFEEGIPLIELPLDLELNYLLYLIDYIERGIKDISEAGWELEDLHEENILINLNSDSNPAKIIDTDYYQIRKIQNQKQALANYKENLRKIFSAVICSIIPELQISDIWEDPNVKRQYLLASMGEITSTEFLRELLYRLNFYNLSGKNIETLQKSI